MLLLEARDPEKRDVIQIMLDAYRQTGSEARAAPVMDITQQAFNGWKYRLGLEKQIDEIAFHQKYGTEVTDDEGKIIEVKWLPPFAYLCNVSHKINQANEQPQAMESKIGRFTADSHSNDVSLSGQKETPAPDLYSAIVALPNSGSDIRQLIYMLLGRSLCSSGLFEHGISVQSACFYPEKL